MRLKGRDPVGEAAIHAGGMDERVRLALGEVDALVRSRDDAWAVPPEGGAFLHGLALARRTQSAIELGTSYGYSTLWIAAALRRTGGRLVTIDREPRKAELARGHLRSAGLDDLVECRTGLIAEQIDALAGPFDFVFIDADKPASADYLRRLRRKLSTGAVIVTDNLIHPRHDWAEFRGLIESDAGLFSMLVPVGNGMELTVVC